MEDLERRAGSSDEAEPEKKPTPNPCKGSKRQAPTTKTQRAQPPAAAAPTRAAAVVVAKPLIQQGQFTPPMETADDIIFSAPVYDERERSRTPPMFPYAAYPAPDELLLDPYGPSQAYPGMPGAAEPYPGYLAAGGLPAALPAAAHFADALKRDAYAGNAAMGTYLGYDFVPGVELGLPSPYDASSAHVSVRPRARRDARAPLTRGPDASSIALV